MAPPMKAYITSIGEETTELCQWALQRNGFETILIQSDNQLWGKLKQIYAMAEEDFIRVDADVIVNRNCTPDNVRICATAYPEAWWVQFRSWGWFTQDLIYSGIQFIKVEALPALRANVTQASEHNRPETYLTRIKEFYDPRRFESHDTAMGLHGYGIKDIKPIIRQKANRGQSANYDFELTKRLNSL